MSCELWFEASVPARPAGVGGGVGDALWLRLFPALSLAASGRPFAAIPDLNALSHGLRGGEPAAEKRKKKKRGGKKKKPEGEKGLITAGRSRADVAQSSTT